MSTIHGYFPNHPQTGEAILTNMLAASDYWQPDQQTQCSNGNQQAHLAKAQLFNTPQSRNDTAYYDPETKNIIVANARIDNRQALAKALGLSDQTAQALPDGQLILKAYLHWGKACPKHLLGDFVFIIWDEAQQKVFAARDHFGVKVLLFSQTEQGLMISNEPNAFFSANWIPKKLKEAWLVDQLWNLGSKPVDTAYHDLELFPAAHILEYQNGQIELQPYWSLEASTQWQHLNDDEQIEELKQRFSLAVERRLKSDYTVACELSEGLDSNGIAGFAATLRPNQTFPTLSYQCEKLTEQNNAVWEKTYQDIFDMLAMHDNLAPIWTEERPNPQLQQTYVDQCGGVFALRGGWRWHCELAQKSGARVLLSGWGGDHCVTTYGDFYEDDLLRQFKLRPLYRLIKAKHQRGRGGRPIKVLLGLTLKHTLPALSHWMIRRKGGLEKALWDRTQFAFVKPEVVERFKLLEQLKVFTDGYRKKTVKAHHRRELFEVGVESRLIDSELAARMHRVEYRYPMLDVSLVEFAYNIPSHLKVFDGIERYQFRRVLEGVTTERIQWRRKADVNHPGIDFQAGLTTEQKQQLQQLLSSDLLASYSRLSALDSDHPQARFTAKQLRTFAPNFQHWIKQNVTVGEG